MVCMYYFACSACLNCVRRVRFTLMLPVFSIDVVRATSKTHPHLSKNPVKMSVSKGKSGERIATSPKRPPAHTTQNKLVPIQYSHRPCEVTRMPDSKFCSRKATNIIESNILRQRVPLILLDQITASCRWSVPRTEHEERHVAISRRGCVV